MRGALNESPPRKAHGTIATLTGLRGLAALHVVLFHESTYFSNDESRTQSTFVANGPLSVTLFYVMSGFVMALVAHRDGSLAGFYTKRFARLAPVYWLALVVHLAHPGLREVLLQSRDGFDHFTYRPWQMALAIALTPLGLQTWVPFVALWSLWNPPCWSVSNEAFFYLVFPCVYPAAVRWGRTARTCITAIAAFAAAKFLLGILYSVASTYIDAHMIHPLYDSARRRSLQAAHPLLLLDVYSTPYLRIIDFFIGAAIGARFNAAASEPPSWAPDLAVALCAAMLALLPVFSTGLVGMWTLTVATGPTMAVAIYCLAFERGVASRVLSSRPLEYLGEWSYSVYLLHFPLLAWYSFIANGGESGRIYCLVEAEDCEGGLRWPHLALAMALIVACSAVVYRCWERPLQAALRQRLLPARVSNDSDAAKGKARVLL